MKVSALIAFRIILASGSIVPLWDALSQESSSPGPGPVPESCPAPNITDALVQLQQKVASNRLNSADIVAKAIQADPQHSFFYAGEVVRFAFRGLAVQFQKS
jgi:hypothetical protein